MITQVLVLLFILFALLTLGFFIFLYWGTRWGSTTEERALEMPGDVYLEGGPKARVSMTRAISIAASPQTVWPWLAQLGRGAGWYSIDWLDNGGRKSARHIISWIPEPKIGDASPVGYLRHMEYNKALVWWVKGTKFVCAMTRLVVDMRLAPENKGSRLIIRMSADAAGFTAKFALLIFQFIDFIMARSQLIGIRERVEHYGLRAKNPDEPETGATDQYQLYEVIYVTGERAGVPGKELAVRWRQTAIEDGLIADSLTFDRGEQ
ncbi:hypothetical protein D1BOALGB6SA_5353 [Olavius sp. associated proteobacterium Delta 1]|nr:hypothetical protein D1BOALGB6SA_5353 [Olavius sp. associated proteobacterium Delta 1]